MIANRKLPPDVGASLYFHMRFSELRISVAEASSPTIKDLEESRQM